MEIQTLIAAASAFVGALAGTGILGWWLATRFSNVYARMNQQETRLSDKLAASERLVLTKIDDHEKLDIERFSKQDIAIMRIELALQGKGTPLHGI